MNMADYETEDASCSSYSCIATCRLQVVASKNPARFYNNIW